MSLLFWCFISEDRAGCLSAADGDGVYRAIADPFCGQGQRGPDAVFVFPHSLAGEGRHRRRGRGCIRSHRKTALVYQAFLKGAVHTGGVCIRDELILQRIGRNGAESEIGKRMVTFPQTFWRRRCFEMKRLGKNAARGRALFLPPYHHFACFFINGGYPALFF